MGNGLLLVNKASGLSSHDVVARARRILKTKQIGHTGTLDPLASGLMVLVLGEATKLSQYILDGDKSYSAEVKFGCRTDTLDMTGVILESFEQRPEMKSIVSHARALEGEFEWEIPIYSAAKVNGKKLYEYARQGEEIVLPKKKMKYWNVQIQAETDEKQIENLRVTMTCSKGSFVRTWIDILGKNLGCGAAMSKLERTASEPYRLEQSMTLEQLQKSIEAGQSLQSLECFVSMAKALPWAKKVLAQGQDLALMRHGQLSHDLRSRLITQVQPGRDELLQIVAVGSQDLVALISFETGHGFQIRRVFNSGH
jgi:tRNA pseudouridine55 synthase